MPKIDFNNVEDLFPAGIIAIKKSDNKYYCRECRRTMEIKMFFKTKRKEKHPSGVLPLCKDCICMKVDDTDTNSFLPILKEVDVPYIPSEWRKLLIKKQLDKKESIVGVYISKMRLNQHKKYCWKDSEKLLEEDTNAVLEALRQTTDTETEALEKLKEMNNFEDIPKDLGQCQKIEPNPSELYGLAPETSKYGLTQKEINSLKIRWGEDYTEDQFLRLEQKYNDMKSAYILNDPIAINNAEIICKIELKANYFLDIGDVESATKLFAQLDHFIKTSNLAPVQQKDRQQATFAISQLAYLLEKEGGFIPTFYADKPKDKIDKILEDMEDYTYSLVRGESSLIQMVENAKEELQNMQSKKIKEKDKFAELEEELFSEQNDVEKQAIMEEIDNTF